MTHIYLDNNSTAPLLPEVADAMRECYARGYANPASQHQPGREARQVLEEAREGIARILGADVDRFDGDRLIFTSGGTEANNLALRGLSGKPPGRIIISAIEHPSVSDTANAMQAEGWDVQQLPVDSSGRVRPEALPPLLDEGTRLVSVMLGNNETGVLQPVEELAAVCNAVGIPLHTDATQVVGKLPVRFRELGVAALTFAAHKFHGPRGIGGLVIRNDVTLQPILRGGFQQGGLRPGTEDVALPVGMHAALASWEAEQEQIASHLLSLRDEFESSLRAERPDIVIHGAAAERLPHTSNVAFPGLDRQALFMALDCVQIACSTGSACASGSSEPSPVLQAMGLDSTLVEGSVRLSFGRQNSIAEVAAAVKRILNACNNLERGKTSSKSARSPPARAANKV